MFLCKISCICFKGLILSKTLRALNFCLSPAILHQENPAQCSCSITLTAAGGGGSTAHTSISLHGEEEEEEKCSSDPMNWSVAKETVYLLVN